MSPHAHSPYASVALDQIRCAIDRDLICEQACCPGGCVADQLREHFRPFKRDQALLPNRVAEALTAQLDAGT